MAFDITGGQWQVEHAFVCFMVLPTQIAYDCSGFETSADRYAEFNYPAYHSRGYNASWGTVLMG
jgi:hypothetical protein